MKRNSTRKNRTPRRLRRILRSWGLLAALVAVGVGGTVLVAFNRGQGDQPPPLQAASLTGTLTAVQNATDFGRISMRNGKVSYRYSLRNETEAPALIEEIYTSCMCTEASLLLGAERVGPFGMPGHVSNPKVNGVVQPGQSVMVEAVFDPQAHGPAGVGRNDRAVSVVLGGQRVLELQFTAYVTP